MNENEFSYTNFVEGLKDSVDHSNNPIFMQATRLLDTNNTEEE